MLASRHQRSGRAQKMAKQKATSRAAAKTAVKKKWAGLGTTAKSSSRKTIKSKGRGLPAVKPRTVTKTAAKAASKTKATSKARPKQRIAISHHREEDFKADGLRTYAQYRDLGIADATH